MNKREARRKRERVDLEREKVNFLGTYFRIVLSIWTAECLLESFVINLKLDQFAR